MNTPFNQFLSKYVTQKNGINLVAYDKVTDADERLLEIYIEELSQTDISEFSREQILAYWFNLYNAQTLDLILDNYPIKSIRKIGFLTGPWDKDILTVRGQEMSLNKIEHDIVRKTYDEPRVHFAFNCASIGCPNLKKTAWEAQTLDADLTQAAKDYISSPRGVRIEDNGDITVSSIFKWYKEDFGQSEADIIAYLATYAEGDKKAALEQASEIEDYDYDWSLNRAK
tara:strand:- start:152 stop:832 length:681 start_codon:yes stop_codon:yes gene_type:complete